jgi:transcriptional regulator with XRE-family HTH domain
VDDDDAPEAGAGWLADRLNKLFTTVLRADGQPHTNQELASWCGDYTGASLSRTSIWHLRHGLRTNPTQRTLDAIAAFFDMMPQYFQRGNELGDRLAEQLDLARHIKATGTEAIVMRGMGLSSGAQAQVAKYINDLYEEEQQGTAGRLGDE